MTVEHIEASGPFLKWIGGKSRTGSYIAEIAQDLLQESGGRFIEPFVGAGHVFFRVQPPVALLGDANWDLINCFRSVARKPASVAVSLDIHRASHSVDHYYDVRTEFNRERRTLTVQAGEPQVVRAAQFIYLNRSSFNGIWRVNAQGDFNTPLGNSKLKLPDRDQLFGISQLLSRASIRCADFGSTLRNARAGDVVYLDPPYSAVPGNGMFTKYTSEKFSSRARARLHRWVRTLSMRGCHTLLSEMDSPLIRKWYADCTILELSNTHWVRAAGSPLRVKEALVLVEPSTKSIS